MIEVRGLRGGYGDREVLHGIDLTLNAGEMAGILGPNGSGKSTLLLALAGVLRPTGGTVRLNGQEVSGLTARERARQMAAVPQRVEVSFPFKCLSVVLMGRYAHLTGWGDYGAEDMEMALTAMEETGTLHLAQRWINAVSGGEAQMVMMARALAQGAPVLLLDEATASLDAAHKMQIFDLLAAKNRQGATLVGVMHDLNLAALYCRRLIFLKGGRVVLDGPTGVTFTGENLSEIYGTQIEVARHPVTGDPQAHFVPGAVAGGAGRHAAGWDERRGAHQHCG